MLEKLFIFRDRDGHYILQFFNKIQFCFKHKPNFKYKPAVDYGVTTTKRDTKLIVSLTSFPARIEYTHKAINTILRQTLKPDKVVLWLAESQFPNKEKDLPESILRLKDLGLEILWCEDLRSYKKLLPSLKAFPDDIIVTADDDLYYEENWLENIYNAYLKDPKNIYVERVCRLKLGEDNKISKYPQRISLYTKYPDPSFLSQMFGGSGCLYPPHSMPDEVFNYEKAKEITNFADDLWFWGMAVLNGTKVCEVNGPKSSFNVVEGTMDTALCKEHAHDDFFAIYYRIFDSYPKVLSNMKEEVNGPIR